MKGQLVDQRTGEVLVLTKQRVIIGRDRAVVDIPVNDTSASRCHCGLFHDQDGWSVIDLGTPNGTYINEKLLKPKKKYPLKYGDELRIAQLSYRFEEESAPGVHDIFISYKYRDKDGHPTQDAQMAEELYHELKKKGFNPFFSKYSVDASRRGEYIEAIDRAMESAGILIAVGTSKENLSSKWVKSEINQFRALMNGESERKRLIISYRSPDFSPNDLPSGIMQFQSYDDLKALVRFVELCLTDKPSFQEGYSKIERAIDEKSQPKPADLPGCRRLQVGDILYDRFHILGFLGEGGMSHVYSAYDRRLRKKVAVKVQKVESGEIAANAMRREAEVLHSLKHHAIPKVYDMVDNGASLVIVREYVEGKSLDKLLAQRTFFPERKVLEFARQLCEMLDYLHNRPEQIIHRDIKPANLILHPDGSLKIIDLGAAGKPDTSSSCHEVSLGTMGYAAPEQYGGQGLVDQRTDLYGLGVTLHQLVTGMNPAVPPYELLPIRQINPKLSRELEAIINKCTQKSKEKRYPSTKALLRAIEQTASKMPPLIKGAQPMGKVQAPVRTLQPKQITAFSRNLKDLSMTGGLKADSTRRQGFSTVIITEVLHRPDQERASSLRPHTGELHCHAELSGKINKLLSMDPKNRQLVFDLIDRLSK